MKSCRYKIFDLNKGQLLVLKVFPLTPHISSPISNTRANPRQQYHRSKYLKAHSD